MTLASCDSTQNFNPPHQGGSGPVVPLTDGGGQRVDAGRMDRPATSTGGHGGKGTGTGGSTGAGGTVSGAGGAAGAAGRGTGGAGGAAGAAGSSAPVDACTACEMAKCSHPSGLTQNTTDDYAGSAAAYEVCFVGAATGFPTTTASRARFCSSSQTGPNATVGPATDMPKTTLCQQLLQCIHQTNCTGGPVVDNKLQCYCGAGVSVSECLMPDFVPSGACDTQIEAALEVTVFATSNKNSADLCLAYGAAIDIYEVCDYNCCVQECLGTPLTGDEDTTFCNAGTGGTPASGGSSGTGGATATGGRGGTGGSPTGTGGVPATGGVPGTGGVPEGTGGVPATGGVPGTGGVPATGGVPGTGGVPATGGVPGTGGVPATGGASGAAGVAGAAGTTGAGGTAGSAGSTGSGGVVGPPPLQNGSFDISVAGWTPNSDASISRSLEDADGNLQSGSLDLVYSGDPTVQQQVGASQCVLVTAGSPLELQAKILVAMGSTAEGFIGLSFYGSTDCSGPIVNVLYSSPSTNTQAWQTVIAYATVPAGVGSLALSARRHQTRRSDVSRGPVRRRFCELTMTGRSRRLAAGTAGHLVMVVLWLAASGCSRPGGPAAFSKSEFPIPDAGVPVVAVQAPPATCTSARSSQPIPPRSTLTAADGQSSPEANIELTSQLFSLFNSVCGGCHVGPNQGGFNVTSATFSQIVNTKNGSFDVLAAMDSTSLSVVMPPYGVVITARDPTDAVVQLRDQLEIWLAAGSPVGQFTLPTSGAVASVGYAISPTLGSQLTNIGSCIPNQPMVGTNTGVMNQLDAMFAAATTLPGTLDQTDLTTLDSASLAQNGVISFAPAYPLWSDDAQKMRYVRVPMGQSIVFDKATQEFQIPPNTRFYKTFLKQVNDANGMQTYKKVETRIIVSRPDTTLPDGTAQQNALFGTYVWNEDESQATLLTDPLRDGKPFADRIFEYTTDEQKAAPIIASNPANLQAALERAGVRRHYALPGSERCIQCHMGSPSQSFVLGFRPVQINRRPTGSGGVYEQAEGDELTQLQRFIDYGIVTGINSLSDVLPLEESEGTRRPRNVEELNAQAYMVGNCAHCHNPRGFPSVRQPAVKAVLDFLPGTGLGQGVFQFPLEAVSPIRKRGQNQETPMPYITPSLYDFPEGEVTKSFCPTLPNGSCGDKPVGQTWVLAPWRSLIYRNTDTPYDYFDDYAAFPHMPLDTSGYDCRVAQIMGDWMVSIPAKIKHPAQSQSVFPDDSGGFPPTANTDPQPYVEVLPGDSGYDAAVGGAAARLAQYHNSYRYGFCPDQYKGDIVDSVIQSEVDANQTVQPDTQQFTSPTNSNLVIMPVMIPVRPDYLSFDDTDPPGAWIPRRPDWETALGINPDIDTFIQTATKNDGLSPDAALDLRNVITALQSVTISDKDRTALTTKVPFGLWDTSTPGCNFTGIPTASSFLGPDQPQWMSVASPLPPNAPVLVESPGAAIFTTVCFNCHGVQADSKGLLADEITNLTGGDARVANFRDGLFGPLSQPGSNRQATFGADAATLKITTDDLTARYMAWMALGGTEKHLPNAVLTEVSQSPVFGIVRGHLALVGTPDMLRLGLTLCEQIAAADGNTGYNLQSLIQFGRMGWSGNTGLVDSTGDAEMWLKLCNLNNRQIVRVADIGGQRLDHDLRRSHPRDQRISPLLGHGREGQRPLWPKSGARRPRKHPDRADCRQPVSDLR